MTPIVYPEARRSDFTEERHGMTVADPYRWMEDVGSDEVKAWVTEQNKLTDSILEGSEFKEKVFAKLKLRYDYEKHGLPWKEGSKWYYWFNTGLQNQSVLYTRNSMTDADEKGEVFLDPNKLAADGTTSVNHTDWTKDGRFLAYGLQKKGSDWTSIHVKNCETGEDFSDVVKWVMYSDLSWTKDGKGFFYSRYPVPAEAGDADYIPGKETTAASNQKLYYHFLGTDQEDDILIYYNKEEPMLRYTGSVTEDGRFLIITCTKGCGPENLLWYVDLEGTDLKQFKEESIVKLVDEFKEKYTVCGNKGTTLYIVTTEDANNKKVVSVDVETKKWGTLIKEEEYPLEWCGFGHNDTLFISYLKDVMDVMYIAKLDTPDERTKVETDIGSCSFSYSLEHPEVFFAVTSFTFAKRIFRFSLDEGPQTSKLWYEASIKDYDSSQFEMKQVRVPSKDGTLVPMFIVHKKGIKLDGNNLTLMYGYGGFRIPLGPAFSTSRLTLMNNLNGVYAQVCLRGGLEYGENWWKEGSLKNKQNTFDDFIYAAKWLQENGYTSPKKLAIQGGSNGGLTVAACANQTPELFRCGVSDVGVLDVTRFHKFTIGEAWTSDYGNPDVKEDYDVLIKYSPLHNIDSSKKYPAILCNTGDHDNRVVPLHTYKYLAELQHQCKGQENPFLASIEVDAGHGGGKPTDKILNELARSYAFIAKFCEATWTD